MKIFYFLFIMVKLNEFPDIDPTNMIKGLKEDIIAKK